MAAYQKNYIVESVLKLDIINEISILSEEAKGEIEKEISKYYTKKTVKIGFNEEIKIDVSGNDIKRNKIEFKEWNFTDIDEKRRFCISPKYIYLSNSEYTSSDDFVGTFLAIINKVKEMFPLLIFSRIGMRYKNIIKFNSDEFEKIADYINKDLLCLVNFGTNIDPICRAIGAIETKNVENDFNVRFQFGILNQNYPAINISKEILLDYDAFKSGEILIDDIESIVPVMHEKLINTFEKSISDKTREKMNGN